MPNAVLIDRDGTLVVERGYITHPDQVELIPGAAEAVMQLRRLGGPILVVTNQAAVARGLITEEELGAIHFRVLALLGAEGATVDGFYYCPHHPDGTVAEYAVECDCRKPRTGLLETASREHGFALHESVVIGDAMRDLQAGRSVGAKTILVRTGLGAKELAGRTALPEADYIVDDLREAARVLTS